MKLQLIFAVAAGATVISAPASAGAPLEAYEVLGVHFGDEPAEVSSAMSAAGFQPEPKKKFQLGRCTSSYETVKAKYVDLRETRVTPRDLECVENFRKGNGDNVTIQYLYKPGGRVVSGVSYQFKSIEKVDQLASRLTTKFGEPCKAFAGDSYAWRSSDECSDGDYGIHLFKIAGYSMYALRMSNGDMRQVFAEELGKDVARSVGDEKAAL